MAKWDVCVSEMNAVFSFCAIAGIGLGDPTSIPPFGHPRLPDFKISTLLVHIAVLRLNDSNHTS